MIIILIVLLFIYWLYWFLRMANRHKFIFYYGKKGVGKTTLASIIALDYNKHKKLSYNINSDKKLFNIIPWGFERNKYTVYANFELVGVDYKYFNPIELGITFFPPPYSILLTDEISLFWHNRQYKTMNPKTLEWFRQQRKYKCIFIGFSQSFDVDKVLRELTDKMYLVRNFIGTFTYVRKIDKFPAIVDTRTDATKQLVDQIEFTPIFLPGAFKFYWIPKYINHFNTFNIYKKEA